MESVETFSCLAQKNKKNGQSKQKKTKKDRISKLGKSSGKRQSAKHF